MPAALEQMVSLLELLLTEVASNHRPAMGINSIGEVLASQTDPRALPVLQLTLVNEIPFLHGAVHPMT